MVRKKIEFHLRASGSAGVGVGFTIGSTNWSEPHVTDTDISVLLSTESMVHYILVTVNKERVFNF